MANKYDLSCMVIKDIDILCKNKMNGIENIGFLGYMSYLKQILTMEESLCLARHQEKSFNFLKPILDNL